MNVLKFAMMAVAALWICACAYGLFWSFAPANNAFGVETSASALTNSNRAGSLGRVRDDMLLAATRLYIETHSDAPETIASGEALAPVEFLNRELARRGETWRVRSTAGLEADVYEVSS